MICRVKQCMGESLGREWCELEMACCNSRLDQLPPLQYFETSVEASHQICGVGPLPRYQLQVSLRVTEYCTQHKEREGLDGVYYCCGEARKHKRSGARTCYPVSAFHFGRGCTIQSLMHVRGTSDVPRDGTGHSILGSAKRSALLLTSRLGVFCAMPAL
jgi:hypothetical protein